MVVRDKKEKTKQKKERRMVDLFFVIFYGAISKFEFGYSMNINLQVAYQHSFCSLLVSSYIYLILKIIIIS